ncbi:MAG: hypothetical protein AB7W16_00830 [Candidatus Obscuribacterales bacterium]
MKASSFSLAGVLTLSAALLPMTVSPVCAEEALKQQGRYLKGGTSSLERNETLEESKEKMQERKDAIKSAPFIQETIGVGGFKSLIEKENSFKIQSVSSLKTNYTQPDMKSNTRFKLHAREGLWAHGVSFAD